MNEAMHNMVEEVQLMEIAQKFIDYAELCDKKEPLNKWYAGITSDPAERSEFHRKDKERFDYYAELHICTNKADALAIERELKARDFSIYKEDLLAANDSATMENTESLEDEKHIVYTFLGAY